MVGTDPSAADKAPTLSMLFSTSLPLIKSLVPFVMSMSMGFPFASVA